MHARATTLCVTTALLALLASGIMATAALAGSGFVLPDGRQWEKVTPEKKYGADIEYDQLGGGLMQAAESGDAITYVTSGPFEAAPAGSTGPEYQQIVSRREPDGEWITRDIVNPHRGRGAVPIGNGFEYKAASSDLSTELAEPAGETFLTPPSTRTPQEPTLYLRDNLTENVAPIVSETDTPPGTIFGETFSPENRVLFEGASPNLEHAVLSTPNELTEPSPEPGPHNLYEWSGNPSEPGHIEIASITPRGEHLPVVKAFLGYNPGGRSTHAVVRNAISIDGSRVVFEARGSSTERLYLRDMSGHETVRVDTPEAGETAESEPFFQGANNDGTRVFFDDDHPLVAGADEGHHLGEGDLYVFEAAKDASLSSGHLHDLTEGGETHGFTIGYGGEGTGSLSEPYNVYFVDSGKLSSNNGVGGGQAAEGGRNLYVDRYNGSEWGTPRFIATLAREDAPSWGESEVTGNARSMTKMTSRVSANGRYLVFMSSESLTGYDNVDAHSGARDEEVFLYDYATNKLVCASCDPSGERPEGVYDPPHEWEHVLLGDELQTWQEHWLAGSIPGWNAGVSQGYSEYQARYLTNSGRLFFESPADLVPGAVNGLEDVYEYEPEGPTCNPSTQSQAEVYKTEGESNGCVGLISSGTSKQESAFLDASAKGGSGTNEEEAEDVFFKTSAQLTSEDIDNSYDIYDAHECSTLVHCATSSTSVPPACSDTDSCRAAPAPQPVIYGAPAGATFTGQGNPAPTSTVEIKTKTAPLTRAQRLATALRACRAKRGKRERVVCEVRARRRYRAAAAERGAVKAGGRTGR